MASQNDNLLLISALSFLIITFVSFLIPGYNTSILEWKIVENKDETKGLFLVGNFAKDVSGVDIYLNFKCLSEESINTELGGFYVNPIKIVWDDNLGQYSFFVNPSGKNDKIDVSMPLLIINNPCDIVVSSKSLVYIRNKGGAYPNAK